MYNIYLSLSTWCHVTDSDVYNNNIFRELSIYFNAHLFSMDDVLWMLCQWASSSCNYVNKCEILDLTVQRDDEKAIALRRQLVEVEFFVKYYIDNAAAGKYNPISHRFSNVGLLSRIECSFASSRVRRALILLNHSKISRWITDNHTMKT